MDEHLSEEGCQKGCAGLCQWSWVRRWPMLHTWDYVCQNESD